MPETDLKLRLLSGNKYAFQVDNLEIRPYTLEEIMKYGYTQYIQNIQWLSITKDNFIESVKDDERRLYLEKQGDSLKTFDFYVKLGGNEFRSTLIIALAMIFRANDIRIIDEQNIVVIDFVKLGIIVEEEDGSSHIDQERLDEIEDSELKIISRDNFDEIVEIVKIQNYLSNPVENKKDDRNPADESTRQLMEEMDRVREKVEKKKRMQSQQDGEGEINIDDIIDAVSSKSNSLNRDTIWGISLYQLYREYARLELIDNYDFQIRAIMAGAEKIDLKHWSSKV